jgi:hypothetical protein
MEHFFPSAAAGKHRLRVTVKAPMIWYVLNPSGVYEACLINKFGEKKTKKKKNTSTRKCVKMSSK